MFDYVSAQEVRLLYKLQLPGFESYLSSNQRIRLELLGLVKDGPGGIQLTPKGVRVAQAGCVAQELREFEAQIYPHQVKLANAGDWRDRHCNHKAREIMPGPLVRWFEDAGDRLWVYGFKTAEQAAAFKAWSESCGIDWNVPASEQPPKTRPPRPPEGPVQGAPAVFRNRPPAC